MTNGFQGGGREGEGEREDEEEEKEKKDEERENKEEEEEEEEEKEEKMRRMRRRRKRSRVRGKRKMRSWSLERRKGENGEKETVREDTTMSSDCMKSTNRLLAHFRIALFVSLACSMRSFTCFRAHWQ